MIVSAAIEPQRPSQSKPSGVTAAVVPAGECGCADRRSGLRQRRGRPPPLPLARGRRGEAGGPDGARRNADGTEGQPCSHLGIERRSEPGHGALPFAVGRVIRPTFTGSSLLCRQIAAFVESITHPGDRRLRSLTRARQCGVAADDPAFGAGSHPLSSGNVVAEQEQHRPVLVRARRHTTPPALRSPSVGARRAIRAPRGGSHRACRRAGRRP